MPSEPTPSEKATDSSIEPDQPTPTDGPATTAAAPDDPTAIGEPDGPGWATGEDVELATALRVAVMRLRRKLNFQRAQDHYLTANQLSVMGTLKIHGAMTIGEVALHEKVRPPSMTRTITSMEELGLVTREPHPSDRRLVVVRLLPAGEGIIRDDRKHRDAWLASRLTALTPEELETLRRAAPILERLAAS